MNESDSIIIIPTYNEKENIEKIIRAIFALEKCFHILVIDDGSPDGTASIVKGLMRSEFTDRLFLVERGENWDWALPTSQASSGVCLMVTTTSSRWMPTSPTHPATCLVCIPLVRTKGMTLPSAAVTSQALTSSTGRWAEC